MNDLERLKNLIGADFNEDDIICSMIDKEDTEVIVDHNGQKSHFEGYGICTLYLAYYNCEEDIFYEIWINDDNVITEVR